MSWLGRFGDWCTAAACIVVICGLCITASVGSIGLVIWSVQKVADLLGVW